MIPVEALQDIRTILVHGYPDGACADGLASSLILRDAFPDAEVRFLVHGTPEYVALAASPGMLFADITPPEVRVSEFVEAGAIVLDHHKSARHVVEAFGERGVYASAETQIGVSGALLAHQVWTQLRREHDPNWSEGWGAELEEFVFYFASLIGIRDTWQRDSPLWQKACELSATLLFYPPEDWLSIQALSENRHRIEERVDAVGAELIRKRDADARKLADAAYRFVTPAGTRVAVVSSCRVSDAADLLAETSDLVVGFAFQGASPRSGAKSDAEVSSLPVMRLSFRSRGKFDCSEIARMLGGGGHAGAAGATLEIREQSAKDHYGESVMRNPYAEIQALVRRFELIQGEIGDP